MIFPGIISDYYNNGKKIEQTNDTQFCNKAFFNFM